jgi:DNA-binding transcriptional LysR family regulator
MAERSPPLDSNNVTLDQLRAFVAVAEEGSFSAAGRKLQRVQSAVSHAMANLESALGVSLWDRSTKRPTLTPEGKALLAGARRVSAEVLALAGLARGLRGGLEPEVALAVDVLLPVRAVVALCREFAQKFPSVELRLYTETMSAVSALVQDGTCQLGIIGPAARAEGLSGEHLVSVRMLPVVAADHPLAKRGARARLTADELSQHTHIVLSERGDQRTPDQALVGAPTWRVADLGTKKALLLAGLGWGNLPEHMIEAELGRKKLVRIRPAEWSEDQWLLPLRVVHKRGLTPAPAAQWLLTRLPTLCGREPGMVQGR